jgi:type 1 glutamine amidotransferase
VNAQYVHCSGHQLNLIIQTRSNTSAAKEFFDAAGHLPNFFSISSQRDDFRNYMLWSARDSDTRSL